MKKLLAPDHIQAPVADSIPVEDTRHGIRRTDDYAWIKDPGYPDVTDEKILSHLKAENTYFNAVMEPHRDLTDTIFEELKSRIQEDEESVPWTDGAYEYRWAFDAGAQYRTWYRRKTSGGAWSVFLDETVEADGKEFFRLGDWAISPDNRLLAFTADTNGSERFTLTVRDLETGEVLTAAAAQETSGELVWQADSKAIAFVKVSKEWRPYLVCALDIKTGAITDVFEEKDTGYFVHIGLTSDRAYMIIRTADHVTAENWYIGTDSLSGSKQCLATRHAGHDYYADHGTDGFYLRSNRDHKNFSIYTAGGADDAWQVFLDGSDTLYIHGMKPFAEFVAVQAREDGLDQIRLLKGPETRGIRETSFLTFPEDVFEAAIGHNPMFNQTHVRVTYTSMITPQSVYDYTVSSGVMTLRKQKILPGGYDAKDYRTSRIMVPVRDGATVPVSIVHHKDWEKGRDAPLHLYGYGAYGIGMSPSFSSARISLLDRGFAYAIAHIRGGDEMGYHWYESGKLEQRTNSFNDFVDVARHLISEGYVQAGHMTISGGSAGGELMGAVLNQAAEIFAGAVLHVPFVDVLNTMLDESLPLTPLEWPEWGNPVADKGAYDLIASYCPYSNIVCKDYPPQLITGGLNDPRVTYWEPAKWAAKMRAQNTAGTLVTMKMNMGAGHGGKSGRFDSLLEIAEEYTFLLMCAEKA